MEREFGSHCLVHALFQTMTVDQLLIEGRRLQRPCLFLRSQESGPVAAIWHEGDCNSDATGYRCRLTVDGRLIPGLEVEGYISVFTDDRRCQGGRVAINPSWPETTGQNSMQIQPASYHQLTHCLPKAQRKLKIGFAHVTGSDPNHSMTTSKMRRSCMNTNGSGCKSFPLYSASDAYAVLGGWHFPWPDGDWHELIDEQLLIFTLRESNLGLRLGILDLVSFE